MQLCAQLQERKITATLKKKLGAEMRTKTRVLPIMCFAAGRAVMCRIVEAFQRRKKIFFSCIVYVATLKYPVKHFSCQ